MSDSESGLADDAYSPKWTDDDRPRIPPVAGEREALTAYLERYRATVEMKCRGLTPEQVRTRSMPPSTMSLHGLVRHLAACERWWFQQNFERRDVPFLFFTEDNPNHRIDSEEFLRLEGEVIDERPDVRNPTPRVGGPLQPGGRAAAPPHPFWGGPGFAATSTVELDQAARTRPSGPAG